MCFISSIKHLFQCLRLEFITFSDKTKLIVAACCALHNYLLNRSPSYASAADRYDIEGNLIEGNWRKNPQMDQINSIIEQDNVTAKQIRDRLSHFYNNVFILPWQSERAFVNRNDYGILNNIKLPSIQLPSSLKHKLRE